MWKHISDQRCGQRSTTAGTRLLASCAPQYCCHQSVVTATLTSTQWPGSVILFQTHSLCWEYIHRLGHNERYWHEQKMLGVACVASTLTILPLRVCSSKLKVLQHFRDWLHPCVSWTWGQSQLLKYWSTFTPWHCCLPKNILLNSVAMKASRLKLKVIWSLLQYTTFHIMATQKANVTIYTEGRKICQHYRRMGHQKQGNCYNH